MPYLKIQFNQNVEQEEELLKRVSRVVAKELGKPEVYVMVAVESDIKMVFAGSTEPTVFMELKSIGLNSSQTENLSRVLCDLASKELGVKKSRVYIEFTDAPGSMWGWNGSTF